MHGPAERSVMLDCKVTEYLTAEGESRPCFVVPLSLIGWYTSMRRTFPSREPAKYRS